MASKSMTLSLTCVLALFLAGCTVATVRVRQKDGTYRTTREIVWWSADDFRSFECRDDYMVASTMAGVTYEWPRGRGYLVDVETTTFTGDGLRCEVHRRNLTLNDRHYAEFAEGDSVRITPDARVLVNGAEQTPLANGQ